MYIQYVSQPKTHKVQPTFNNSNTVMCQTKFFNIPLLLYNTFLKIYFCTKEVNFKILNGKLLIVNSLNIKFTL